jgi:UDP-glucose 4-epimerase
MKIDFQEDRPADVPRLWVDPTKFKRITNFKSSVTFAEGLKETIEYYKQLMDSKDMLAEIQVKNWEK